jgi:hypothetical protein
MLRYGNFLENSLLADYLSLSEAGKATVRTVLGEYHNPQNFWGNHLRITSNAKTMRSSLDSNGIV